MTIYGLVDDDRLTERVPTFSFTLQGQRAAAGGGSAGQEGFMCGMATITPWRSPNGWGWRTSGGMVRVGPVHYNTVEEIHRFGEALGRDKEDDAFVIVEPKNSAVLC